MTPPPIPARPSGAVRVLHTSDWHLGVTVRGRSRAVDHDAVVDEIVERTVEAGPDLVVHTGDLFDGPRPPMAELARAIVALRRLAEVAPVVVLAGNHDSAITFETLAVAVEDGHEADREAGTFDPRATCPHRIRVHPRPVVPEAGAVTTYATQSGVPLRVGVLPFVHQNRVITEFADLVEANATYNDAIRKLVALIARGCFADFDPTREVAVLASHLHVTGAATSSERTIHVSEDYATDSAHLDERFGYLAFGHIHVPQPIAGGRGAYAGSILQVDFGERDEEKRIMVVDLEPGRPSRQTSVPLGAGRRLHQVRGTLAEVAAQADAVGSDLVEVTVTGDGAEAAADLDGPVRLGEATFDTLTEAVAAVLPDAEVVGVVDGRRAAVSITADDLPVAVETVGEAYRTWLVAEGAGLVAKHGDGRADPGRVAELFDDLLAAVGAGEAAEPRELIDVAALEEG